MFASDRFLYVKASHCFNKRDLLCWVYALDQIPLTVRKLKIAVENQTEPSHIG